LHKRCVEDKPRLSENKGSEIQFTNLKKHITEEKNHEIRINNINNNPINYKLLSNLIEVAQNIKEK